MATSTGPNLTSARDAVERLMDDTCLIRRNELGVHDGVLDPQTGRVLEPADATVVFTGRCKIKHRGEGERQSMYEIGYPIGGLAPAEGDEVTITSARRDPKLVGLRLRIYEVVRGTFAIQHKVYAIVEPG
jgi:hypothetical protein